MTDDPRCCGSGTCIINDAGECWCGQRWDGRTMCAPRPGPAPAVAAPPEPEPIDDDRAASP